MEGAWERSSEGSETSSEQCFEGGYCGGCGRAVAGGGGGGGV